MLLYLKKNRVLQISNLLKQQGGNKMIKINRMKSVFAHAWILAAILFLISGCAALSKDDKKEASGSTFQKEKKNMPSYYDFGDVLIPNELKIDTDSSFVYKAPGFSGGVLALSGRVEIGSLTTFFEENMAKDNWKLISTFKSPRTVMLFQKQNRWCVINITDGDFSTDVEIWVAPSVAEGGSGLLK
ncbi:MAG: hypothetical protein QG578_560 [Thermodesulfobacteriota bacterium]|nr:hypothetical protein [Thermodesulfobacteriota bacterium]